MGYNAETKDGYNIVLSNEKKSISRGGGTGKGRPRLIKNPVELWDKFLAYVKDVEDNPLMATKVFKTKQGFVHALVRKMRPLTIRGFCTFIGVTHHAWRKWHKYEDLQWTIELIENAIYVQKFEGAAAGLLKANIISRELDFGRNS